MSAQKAVTTLAQNKSDELIQISRCTCPEEKAKMIDDKLKYKLYALQKEKIRSTQNNLRKKIPLDFMEFNSG
ncbi:hypothetical protein FACS189430_03460 [Bacteroidia bacterium]|nr:hypothetical protein FACS189430_03460 [Bacteroidia bacterium]